MVNIERYSYHVVSEKEILEKLKRENPTRNAYLCVHAMMAWEYMEEPIEENESDSENFNSPNNEENPEKNLEGEEANDEFSASSSSTDYGHLEQETIQRQHSFAWQHED